MRTLLVALPNLQPEAERGREVIEFSPRAKAEQAAYLIIFDAAQHPEHTDAAGYECDKCTATACAVVSEVRGEDDVRACTGCGTCAICAALPRGLCGDRFDHAPHVHDSTSLGRFWCEADQSKRLPYALERKTQQHETHEIIACTGCASGCEGCN